LNLLLNYTKNTKGEMFYFSKYFKQFHLFFSQLYLQKSTVKAKEKLELEAMMDAALFGAGWILPSAK